MRAQAAEAVSLSTTWQAMGPSQVQTAAYGLVTGRVTSVAIDAADPSANTVYVGTTGGGVWKSTNAAGPAGSVRFAPLTDTLPAFTANAGTSAVPSLSIGAVSVQPGGTGVVLAGTGDPNDALDSYYGTGLLRSGDGGQTWALVAGSDDGVAGHHSFFGEGFAEFAWSGASPQVVVAAVSSSAEGTITRASTAGASVRGLYYSTDAGVTWQMSTIQDGGATVQSAASQFAFSEGNAAPAVVWNPVRRRFYAAVRFHGFYESVDGMAFTRLATQPGSGLSATACPARTGSVGLSACPLFRGALAVQPVSGDLFALYADNKNADGGLWQDVCSPTGSGCSADVAWAARLNSTPMEDGHGVLPQADYNLTLTAVPAATALKVDDTLIFAGTADVFRCSMAGGCALRNTTNAMNGCAAPAKVSPAQHAMAWQANAADTAEPRVFFGNDGGLWRSLDGVRQQSTPCSPDDATHFDNLNGSLGSLAEVNGLASDPRDPTTLLVALGGSGSAASITSAQASGQSPWMQMGTGESGSVAIDQAEPLHWYVQSGAGVALHGCAKGAACSPDDFGGVPAVSAAEVASDLSLIDAPFLLDPALNMNVLVGTCRVWRGPAAGGAGWSSSDAISPPLAGPNDGSCSANNASVRSLAAGGNAVLSGSVQGSGSPVIYAGLAGSQDGGQAFGGRLFATAAANRADGGTRWTDVSVNPVINEGASGGQFNPYGFDVSSIAVDPHDSTGATVYATVMGFGTDHVYRSVDGGANWSNISANLPDAPANAVAVDPNDGATLYIATDTGVYVTTAVESCTAAGAQCWSAYGTALPNAPVVSLVASANVTVSGALAPGALRVGTYGRGVWQIPLVTGGPLGRVSATLSPASLHFADQAVHTTSAPLSVSVENHGNLPLTVSRVTSTAQWQAAGNCAGATLVPGAACTVQVTFSPGGAGAQAGTLLVYANVPGGYVTAALQGSGTTASAVALSPSALQFPATVLGVTSPEQTVTVTNSGSGASALQAATVTGDFSIRANRCGGSLGAGESCSFAVVFTPTAAGVRQGTLSIVDGDGNHTVALSGSGAGGQLTASAGTIQFPDASVNSTGAARTVTVTNSGTAPIAVNAVTLTGDFRESDTCAGATLQVGESCSLSLTFMPAGTGARAGLLTVTGSSGGTASSSANVVLSGTGVGAFHVVLLPQALDFSTVPVGSASPVQNVTISNTGIVTGDLGAITATSEFVLKANTCGAVLPPKTGCTVSVVFTPSAPGVRTGTLSVSDDEGTQTASLRGTGTLPATDSLTPLALSFGAQTVGTTSAGQQITLSNDGDVPLTLVSAEIASGDFTASNGCGPALAAHSSCGITIAFAPKSVGALTGSLVVADVKRTQTISLNGLATAGPGVSLTPATLTFSNTGVGNASAGQTVTLTNNGGAPLRISGIAADGDFGILAGSNTCPAGTPLNVRESCTMQVAFAPAGAGARPGTLTVSSDAPPQIVHLNGNGVDFTLSPNGTVTATVSNGTVAVYALLLRPAVTTSEPVSFACTGAPANALCNVTGTYADLSAINSVRVTLATGIAATSAIREHRKGAWLLAVLLPGVSLLPLWRVRRRQKWRGLVIAMLFGVALTCVVGCGAGRELPKMGPGSSGTGGPTAVTPPGTYTIAVTATSAGLRREVDLTLTVK